MPHVDFVKRLAGAMVANDVTTLEVTGNDYSIRMVRAPGAVATARTRVTTRSPATGVFHHRGHDDGFAPLEAGAMVLEGEPLGYVGIGPVRLLCVAAATGQLAGSVPSEGQSVTAHAPLFTVEHEI